MKRILVVGADWKFRALVRAELRERGYEAYGYQDLEPVASEQALKELAPLLLVFDAAGKEAATVGEIFKQWAPRLPIIAVVSPMAASVQPPANVTLLPHPVRVGDIVAAVVERIGPAT